MFQSVVLPLNEVQVLPCHSLRTLKKPPHKKELKKQPVTIHEVIKKQESVSEVDSKEKNEKKDVRVVLPANESANIETKEAEAIPKPQLTANKKEEKAQEVSKDKIEIKPVDPSSELSNSKKEPMNSPSSDKKVRLSSARICELPIKRRYTVDGKMKPVEMRVPVKSNSSNTIKSELNPVLEPDTTARNLLSKSKELQHDDDVEKDSEAIKEKDVKIDIQENNEEKVIILDKIEDTPKSPSNAFEDPVISSNSSVIKKSSIDDASISKNSIKTFDHKSMPEISVLMQFTQSEESQLVRDSYSLPSSMSNTSVNFTELIHEQPHSTIQVALQAN